jgi:hypothetical protein
MTTVHTVRAISPKTIKSPYDLPDSPKYISKEDIEKITNINDLKKKEKQYDEFLDKKWHVLLLLDQAEEILEIRDLIVFRIIVLEREKKELIQMMLNFISS